jgi:hypothetical protein
LIHGQTPFCAGLNLQPTTLYPNGWTGFENPSVFCSESHKPGQTVRDKEIFRYEKVIFLVLVSTIHNIDGDMI